MVYFKQREPVSQSRFEEAQCLGLYDMLGNVGEWVLDQYSRDYYATITDKAVDPL